MNFYFDIETIPTQNQSIIDEIKKSITAPGNHTKPESIQKWLDENLEIEADKKHRQTSFDGLHGEIISIAWAFDDENPEVLFRTKSDSEADLLNAFFEDITIHKDQHGQRIAITKWIGHYITGFDLRFLWQRCVINKVNPLIKIPHQAKPWDDQVFDTKVAWSGTSQYSGQSSLDAICKGFGYEGKGEITGANVYDYWLAGEYEKIAEYNKDDVVKTRLLFKRMNFID